MFCTRGSVCKAGTRERQGRRVVIKGDKYDRSPMLPFVMRETPTRLRGRGRGPNVNNDGGPAVLSRTLLDVKSVVDRDEAARSEVP